MNKRFRKETTTSWLFPFLYIAALSTRQLYDENGTPVLCVDEEMRRRLETKLITRILNFKLIA